MKAKTRPAAELAIKMFKGPKEFETWLGTNHATCKGLWLRIAKKDSGLTSITYPEALDAALCYGWIDGQKKRHDEKSWLQRFTPRGPRSIWSKVNTQHTRRLIAQGRMKAAGEKAIDDAKKDGRWAAAYESQSKATVPEDLQAALNGNPEAKAFFATLESNNRYAVLFRVHGAKRPETRARRIAKFVAMLARREKVHP
jgi:uncharacterized protein YdeI (YjbR/CyaY-like superfamily)